MSSSANNDTAKDKSDDKDSDHDDTNSLENPFEELRQPPPLSSLQYHGTATDVAASSSSPLMEDSFESSKRSTDTLLRSIIDEYEEYESSNSSSSSSSRRLPVATASAITLGIGNHGAESGHQSISEGSSGSASRISFSGLDKAIKQDTGGSASRKSLTTMQQPPQQPHHPQNRRQSVNNNTADGNNTNSATIGSSTQKQKRVHEALIMKQSQQRNSLGSSSSRRQKSHRWSMSSGQPSVALSGNSESSDPAVIAEYVIEPENPVTPGGGSGSRRINPFRRDSKKRTPNLLSSKLNRRKHIQGLIRQKRTTTAKTRRARIITTRNNTSQ